MHATRKYVCQARLLSTIAAVLMLSACAKENGPSVVFDFTRLAADGSAYSGSGDFDSDPWSCVRDNRTGLVWEVKTGQSELHSAGNTYTWYETDEDNNGGHPGTANGGKCADSQCDTRSYVAAVNAKGLCGHNDWRLPNLEELATLVDSTAKHPGPTVDQRFFPETMAAEYWTGTPYVTYYGGAWTWSFEHGLNRVDWKNSAKHVRLVRGMPTTQSESQNIPSRRSLD